MTLKLLDGVRVLEMALIIPGDQAGEMLADLGAEVIKIEPPPYGDYMREMWAVDEDEDVGAMHLMLNRNKKSVTLDLKKEEGRKIFFRLLETADVVTDLSLPGTRDKLGVGYEDCRKVKPDIVYASITGYGYTGPYAQLPCHGVSVGALTGGSSVVDLGGGRLSIGPGRANWSGVVPAFAVMGIASALVRRSLTGEGSWIDASMLDAAVYGNHVAAFEHTNPSLTVNSPITGADSARVNNYYTKDHKVMMLACPEERFWSRFCAAIDRPDLAAWRGNWDTETMDWGADPELTEQVRQVFLTKTQQEWMDLLLPAGVPVVPSGTFEEMLDNQELVQGRGLITSYFEPRLKKEINLAAFPIRAGGAAAEVDIPAPDAGQHNAEVLAEIGLGPADLDRLYAEGVLFRGGRAARKAAT